MEIQSQEDSISNSIIEQSNVSSSASDPSQMQCVGAESEDSSFIENTVETEDNDGDGDEDDDIDEDIAKSKFNVTGDDDEIQDIEEESEKGVDENDKSESAWYDDDFSEDEEESEEEDIDESEIDSLLEEGLPKSKRIGKKVDNAIVSEKLMKTGKHKDLGKDLTIKKIVVLEEKGGNSFEVLPGGWIQVRHSSGMPMYLHRKSRVCTLAKPYYLGPGSVRRHSVPLSGIPCLAYRRALEKEKNDKELLEKKVKELEIQQEAIVTTDKPETISLLTKCLNAASSKEQRFKKLELIPDSSLKLSLKRKIEENNKTAEMIKLKIFKAEEQTSSNKINEDKSSSNNTSETSTISVGTELPVSIEQTAGSSVDPAIEFSDDVCLPNIPEFNIPDATNTGIVSAPTEETVLSNIKENLKDKKDTSGILVGHFKRGRRNKDGSGMRALIPLAKVETAKENASLYSVAPLDLREYCRPLFNFAEVECKRFKTWKARRHHTKELKRRQLERPTLPDSAQVIKFFDLSSCKGNEEQMVKKFTDYVFNPNGKSSVCILHEFVQHTLRKQPTYAFQELENAATPYSACVLINGTPYGRGYGSSKKTAKAEAAKATLEVLIPQMKGQLNGSKTDSSSDFDITEYFQQVDMTDVRIPKMCTSVSEPSPYTLLLTCLQRNFGLMGSSNVKFEMLPTDLTKGNLNNTFQMTADQYSVTVTASNKREGKQLASQLLLAKIHPHINNFGAFIKMYGNGSIKSVKEKKQEEQQITTLQSKASANSPNWAILNKLRTEMLKLATEENVPMPPEDSPFIASNSSNDNDVDNKEEVAQAESCPFLPNINIEEEEKSAKKPIEIFDDDDICAFNNSEFYVA